MLALFQVRSVKALEWKKVKNIIILLLAAVNIFLLLNLYSLMRDERIAMKEASAGTVAYLNSKGISIDENIIPEKNRSRKTTVIERSEDSEIAIASSLVNGDKVTSAGSTITVAGVNGTATWRSGALLDADITVPGIYNSGDEAVLIAYLEAAGIHTAGYTAESDELGFTLTINKRLGGDSVMNCSLVIRCEENDRATVSGRWFTGDGVALDDYTEIDPPGLIIKYVEHMERSGVNTISIDNVENGYIVQQMTKIGIILLPVLKITADGNSTYISATDGSIVLSETY